MRQIGQAVIIATKCIHAKGMSPKDAWDFAIAQVSGSLSVQTKSCPRNAFLGLCEAGAVVGIKPGKYGAPRNNKNGRYALNALGILQASPMACHDKQELWAKATAPQHLLENQQMDVVLALWEHKLLR